MKKRGPALSLSNGFTLIELMVSVAIVAVLGVIAIVIYTSVLAGSRDQQRIRGLNTYQQSLELYRHDLGQYPDPTGFPSALNPKYLPTGSQPTDPSNITPYPYYTCSPSGSCTSYCLYAKLEKNPTTTSAICSAVSPYNYAVNSP